MFRAQVVMFESALKAHGFSRAVSIAFSWRLTVCGKNSASSQGIAFSYQGVALAMP
jgi:hypothetical protein